MKFTRNKFMIGVFGPTGIGKTKLGVTISKSIRGEVISIDSLQCYSPGGIVTARPTPQEVDGVTHHMIGYLLGDVEPTSFVADAIDKLEELHKHEISPVVVGGSTSLTMPFLHGAFGRGWRMAAIILLPHQSTYQQNINCRLEEMMESGLLEELSDLKLPEDRLLERKPDFNKGVWKAIGYQDLYPYLEVQETDERRYQLLKSGTDSMKARTVRYGLEQLEWIRHTLLPLLSIEEVASMCLPVVDKSSWISDVDKPAIQMVREFVYGKNSIKANELSSEKPRVVCIFGGSSPGHDPAHMEAAKSLAKVFHQNNIKLVYGGGTTGIMGSVASTLVELTGPDAVHGVIPAALAEYEAREPGALLNGSTYTRFGKRTIVKDMHSRKRLMIQEVIDGGKGSGFVGLSGGYGTLEELLEVTTWHQLGIHDRGVCLYSVGGFYDGLVRWLNQVVNEGFIHSDDAAIIKIETTAEAVVKCLNHEPTFSRKGQPEWA